MEPAINDSNAHAGIDETQREKGLRSLRLQNARDLLRILQASKQASKQAGRQAGRASLLDVGCAHGWFLETATEDYDALGIEPDTAVARQVLARGLPVREGYFPDVLRADELFDVIVFNDVFEHIPDAKAITRACFRHLNPGGVLVLNVPNSRGIFYRISKLAAAFGQNDSFLRMWQFGYPSPHVHYFNKFNLTALIAQEGFTQKRVTTIQSVSRKGLWERIRYAGGGYIKAAVFFSAVSILLPILNAFEQDSLVILFEKK